MAKMITTEGFENFLIELREKQKVQIAFYSLLEALRFPENTEDS
jgi:hypothetical protein